MDECLEEDLSFLFFFPFVLPEGLVPIQNQSGDKLCCDQRVWREPQISEVCGMLGVFRPQSPPLHPLAGCNRALTSVLTLLQNATNSLISIEPALLPTHQAAVSSQQEEAFNSPPPPPHGPFGDPKGCLPCYALRARCAPHSGAGRHVG